MKRLIIWLRKWLIWHYVTLQQTSPKTWKKSSPWRNLGKLLSENAAKRQTKLYTKFDLQTKQNQHTNFHGVKWCTSKHLIEVQARIVLFSLCRIWMQFIGFLDLNEILLHLQRCDRCVVKLMWRQIGWVKSVEKLNESFWINRHRSNRRVNLCKLPGLFGLLRFHGCLLVWMRAQRQTSVCFLDFLLKAPNDWSFLSFSCSLYKL